MEHLPVIKDPAYPLPQIPCVCDAKDYDGQGMTGFPERIGWQIDKESGPVRVDETRSQVNSPAALLQAWLFFGFIQDVFSIGETNVPLQSFRQDIEGRAVLTTASLKASLDKLAQNAKELSSDAYLDRQKRVFGCFKTILGFLDAHWNPRARETNWRLSSIFSLDQILVLLILGETLKNAIVQIWPIPPENSPIRWYSFIRNQNELRGRLLNLGWCPSEASMLFNEIDNTGLFLASLIKRPYSNKLNHESCDEKRCLALQISDGVYETKHVDGCTSCDHVVIDQRKICAILQSGGSPIIFWLPPAEEGGVPKVRIIDFNSNSVEYYAISHVWAHGLGNPERNSLPVCQVTRLQHLIGKLAFSVTGSFKQPAFWIDTLCVPVDPRFKPQRKIAIARLDDTFRYAKQILVLDADLQLSSKNCSRTELATRVLCSGWMRRLWTLSEAVVTDSVANAGKVDLQFLEGSVEFNAVAGKTIWRIHNTEDALKTIFSAFPQYRARDRAYAFLTRALMYRTTSRSEDEAICIASILGLGSENIKSIANADTAEERTQLLYTLVGQIPASILFNRSQKLQEGFRWAPATLLGGTQRSSFPGPSGKCDVEGLHVQFSGYIVTELRPRSRNLAQPSGAGCYVGNIEEAAPAFHVSPTRSGMGVTTSKSSVDDEHVFNDFLIKTETPAFIVNPHDHTESVLVSVTLYQDQVIHAIFESKVCIRKPRMETGSHDDWRNNVIEVREVSDEQKWCIR